MRLKGGEFEWISGYVKDFRAVRERPSLPLLEVRPHAWNPPRIEYAKVVVLQSRLQLALNYKLSNQVVYCDAKVEVQNMTPFSSPANEDSLLVLDIRFLCN